MTSGEEDPPAVEAGTGDARRSAGATIPRRDADADAAGVFRPAGRLALPFDVPVPARDGFEPSFRDFDRAMIAPVLK